MNILITGIPAVGKSTIANEFVKFGFDIYSDKDFVNKKNAKDVIEYKHKMKDVDLMQFAKTANSKLKNKKNIVLEGILFPYCLKSLNIKFDYIFVLSLPEKELRKRYKQRKYPEAKILDNLFVQENNLLYAQIIQSLNKKDLPIIAEINASNKQDINITKLVDVIYSTYSLI